MDNSEAQQPLFDRNEMASIMVKPAPIHVDVADEMDDEIRAALTAHDDENLTPERQQETIDLFAARTDAWLGASSPRFSSSLSSPCPASPRDRRWPTTTTSRSSSAPSG